MRVCKCPKWKCLKWTVEEDIVLKEVFPNGEKKAIMGALKNRTWRAIQARAYTFNLHRPMAMISSRNPQWKGDKASEDSARQRAERIYGHIKGKDIHHKDGNPYNNLPENIAFLSRKAHMVNDGRLTNRNDIGRFKTKLVVKE